MNKLVIYGDGLIAEVAHFYFGRETDYQIVAFSNTAEYIKSDSMFGLPVVPFEDIETRYPAASHRMFIALGYAKRNAIRAQRYREAKAKGYALATFISSRATYYGTPVGDNCFILEGSTVQPFTRIGSNTTLWSGSQISHHSSVGDHCFFSSHVAVSGCCTIGEQCFLGVNSTLRDNISIGDRAVVGAGSLLLEDIPPDAVVLPDPSRQRVVLKDRG